MLALVDSLMEMSKINQALCKQPSTLLSRTEFDRTKENLSGMLFMYQARQPEKSFANEIFVAVNEEPLKRFAV